MRSSILVLLLSFFLVACGTTSGIKHGGNESSQLNLSSYSMVTIGDFSDSTKKQDLPVSASRDFGDLIAREIIKKAVFDEVTKEPVDTQAITIGGEITRYAKGNAALKALVGFGAGSTYFDAKVTFHDSISGEFLGEVVVDKNSWGAGGWLAASQTIESFMTGAAKKKQYQ